ncbi:MAG: carotenoid oxygenase family protein [Deltaproteobacteria bacterium]|nr:carotenoid oxygenase family protein [Deltaproteobacteria bacterium]
MTATPPVPPNPYLVGAFAPQAQEITAHDLTVLEGEIPRELRGMFVRNGANPRFAPPGRYHWFDGDAMVHGVHLEDGRASYANRFVRSRDFLAEDAAGRALWGGILDPIPPENRDHPDKDTANTDLVWHNGRLLATWWLGGEPVALAVPSLDTVGPYSYEGRLGCGLASHPKVDPRTGELVFFDYSPYRAPYLTYGVASADGSRITTTPIELPGPRLLHDIAITQHFTIFLDFPMFWDMGGLASGRRRVGFDAERPSRFGIVPRHGTNADVRWFEAPPCYCYHTINAWEDGDVVELLACRIENPLPRTRESDGKIPRLFFLELNPFLTRWRFDLKTGAVSEERLDDRPTEFPRMNNQQLGVKTRYSYNPSIAESSELLFDGVIQYDTERGTSAHHRWGAGRFGGEVVFAPRSGATDENDGWLVTFVHDTHTELSELVVLDARDVGAAKPVARLHIPQRVPIGFHAWWVRGEDMDHAAT